MPDRALARQIYRRMADDLRREVDAARRTTSRRAHVGDALMKGAQEALARLPYDMCQEPRPFGTECVALVITTVALALGTPEMTAH